VVRGHVPAYKAMSHYLPGSHRRHWWSGTCWCSPPHCSCSASVEPQWTWRPSNQDTNSEGESNAIIISVHTLSNRPFPLWCTVYHTWTHSQAEEIVSRLQYVATQWVWTLASLPDHRIAFCAYHIWECGYTQCYVPPVWIVVTGSTYLL